MDWPLVGRQDELFVVAEEMGREEAVGVILVGPPGVGRTRLALECQRVGERTGFACTRMTATKAASAIPFGALAPILPDTAGSHPGPSALLRAAADGIAERAAGRPVLLVVDDMHLLDDGSATLLSQLAVMQRVFLIGTVRTGAVVPDPIVSLWKDELARRIDVAALDPSDVKTLLEQVLGGPLDDAAAAAFWKTSAGNPLLLRELVETSLETDGLITRQDVWLLNKPLEANARLAEVVARDIDALPDDAQRLLGLVALGEPVEVALLEEQHGAETVEMLERQGFIIVEASRRRLDARLAQPMYGEVLRSRMLPLQRRSAFRELSRFVEAKGARRSTDLLRVAAWKLEEGARLPSDVALRAARRASRLFDHDLAARLARAALADGAGIEAMVLLSAALTRSGDQRETAAQLAELRERASTDAEISLLALVHAEYPFVFSMPHGLDDAHALLDEAIGRVSDPDWRDELEGHKAYIDVLSRRPERALALADSPVLQTPSRAMVRSSVAVELALAIGGRASEAVAISDRAHAAHLTMRDEPLLLHPALHLLFRAHALCALGHVDDALRASSEAYSQSISEADVRVQCWASSEIARVHLQRGDLQEAITFARVGAAISRDIDRPSSERFCLESLVMAYAMAGDPASARHALDWTEENSTLIVIADAEIERGRAWVAAAEGDLKTARSGLAAAAEDAAEHGEHSIEILALMDLSRLGGADRSAPRLHELASFVQGDLVKIAAADADARRTTDADGLAASAHAFETAGMSLHAAECWLAAADAARTANPRGAARYERQAVMLLERCRGAATPGIASVGTVSRASLTEREREVAALAAEGSSSREIADRLFLSVRTVDNQLQRVFRKLGLTGRSELATALLELDRQLGR